MQFIMVDGKGDPNHAEYQQAVELLYTLSYTIKFKGKHFPGYVDYIVPPLEGLWWEEDGSFNLAARDKWNWTSMIRQYDFVTQEVFTWAIETAKQKNPDLDWKVGSEPRLYNNFHNNKESQMRFFDYSKARLETFTEGLCVQVMHTGPYAEEPATIEKLHQFMIENNLASAIGKGRRHHELYVMNPLKTAPEKLKTVLRIPVEKK
jgi:hypothetical protein